MIRDQYFRRLVEAAPVALFASGIDGSRAWWPWRMNKAGAEADARHRSACNVYAVDSNFRDESVTNIDVLNEAVELDADIAVLSDVYHDAEATVEALRDGLQTAETHEFGGTVLLPLQPDHVDCYRRLVDHVPDSVPVWWGIGGLKDADVREKLDAARDLRREAGDEAHIHGFGWGVTSQLARVVRDSPDLLDSIDNSTAVQNANTEAVMPGTERMSVVAARASAQRIEDLRSMTPFVDGDDPADLRHSGQTGMEAFATND